MKRLLFLVTSLATLCFSSSSVLKTKNVPEDRSSKFLPFLAVVSFPNTECTMTDGKQGVCYSKKQCTAKGGTASASTCAEGYGICCSFTQSCPSGGGESVVKNNLTVITSAAFPHSCKFVIPKQKGVCQIRLDFQRFQLGNVVVPPGSGNGAINPPIPPWVEPPAHDCVMDKLAISSTANLPDGLTLCGYAQDHVYLDYGSLEKVTLDINAVTQGGYDIKVTMIKCNSVNKAPDGCTQYFTNRTRQVQSFNYPFAQLNNQRYSVCIANPDAAQKITWRPCQASMMPNPPPSQFFISGTLAGTAASTPANCPRDYVLLPGTPDERYCGGNFTDAVTSNKIPFLMWVNFNEWEIPKEITGPPSMTIDPTTGCPLYQTCTKLGIPAFPTMPGELCDDMTNNGVCAISQIYIDMIDMGNTGFCLEYSLG